MNRMGALETVRDAITAAHSAAPAPEFAVDPAGALRYFAEQQALRLAADCVEEWGPLYTDRGSVEAQFAARAIAEFVHHQIVTMLQEVGSPTLGPAWAYYEQGAQA
ncbi:hypothetical protein ACFC1T_09020 [Kitasatospora sp. NPDC056076]|uniref:hypothetical protein n=1 Tax=Kitasatospora sp. NPDC056076 TaxID=3345703 RepID=UPI0035D95D0E